MKKARVSGIFDVCSPRMRGIRNTIEANILSVLQAIKAYPTLSKEILATASNAAMINEVTLA